MMPTDPDEILAWRCSLLRQVKEWLLDPETKVKLDHGAIFDAAQALQYHIDLLQETWRWKQRKIK